MIYEQNIINNDVQEMVLDTFLHHDEQTRKGSEHFVYPKEKVYNSIFFFFSQEKILK